MSITFAQMGLSIAQGVGNFASASIEARMRRSTQAFRNTMAALSAAQSQNAITVNEIGVLDGADQLREQQQIAAVQQEGAAAVASAAAGVSGTTTELVVKDLKASAARANKARLDNVENQFLSFGQERKNIELSRIYNRDISVIPKPSAASAALGIGTNLLGVYDSNQTPGNTIASRLSGTLNKSNSRLLPSRPFKGTSALI